MKREHGLLESPTGTGKTLCLLSAVLAWREAYAAHQLLLKLASQGHHSSQEELWKATALKEAIGLAPETPETKLPTIYFASRTHSQLTQAMTELKRMPYAAKASVLGSRQQLCLNPEVQRAPTMAARSNACRAKISTKSCTFHTRTQASKPSYQKQWVEREGVVDIEELAAFGRRHQACPYYLTKEVMPEADILFVPYHYLLDAQSRRAQQINVKEAIIIFDEAHNLESTCGEATSFSFTSSDIKQCVQEVAACLKEAAVPKAKSVALSKEQIKDLETLQQAFRKLLAHFLGIPLHTAPASKFQQQPTAGLEQSGEFIFDFLAEGANMTFDTAPFFLQTVESAHLYLQQQARTTSTAISALQQFSSLLQLLFPNTMGMTMADQSDHIRKNYKCHISRSGEGAGAERTFAFWCFNPGVAMQDLIKEGCRSLLFASGTLAPLPSFAAEFGIDFRHQIENPHVIDPVRQLLVGVLTKGPCDVALNARFESRDRADYKADLGHALVNLARIIPHGVLVFFPSYAVMDHTVAFWQSTAEQPKGKQVQKTIWQRLGGLKVLITEPKDKALLPALMQEFYQRVDRAAAGQTTQGAIFFAVCRGKVSEGVDFADRKGRAVVITGIPFPAVTDTKINMKKQYLDDAAAMGYSRLNGYTWYTQQAARAVNQAIGRVIRHRLDHGAILLCDDRFASPQQMAQLPAWVRPHVQVWSHFGEAHVAVSRFFKQIEHAPLEGTVTSENVPDDMETVAYLTHAVLVNAMGGPFALRTMRDLLTWLQSGQRKTLRKRSVVEQEEGEEIEPGKKTKVASPKKEDEGAQYVADMKKLLPPNEYKLFKASVKAFHLKKKTMDEVFDTLSGFLTLPDRVGYLSKFAVYIPRSQRQDWVDKCGALQRKMEEDAEIAKHEARTAAAVAQTVLCVVCQSAPENPHKGPCGHVACYPCWQSTLRELPECKACKMYTRKKQLQRAFFY